MFWLLLFVFSAAHATPVRMCVREPLLESCHQMSSDLPEAFTCVSAPDSIGCVKKVAAGDADLTNVRTEALYLAGKYFNLQAITTELVDGEPYKYQGIALVRKGSDILSARDLRNRTSCHTGVGRHTGWLIPLGRLLSSGIMEQDCEEGDLAAVQKFFSGSCAPGEWSMDPLVDKTLKSKYPELCSRCKNATTCSRFDEFCGYRGVMQCLSEGAADVAFTKIHALNDYLVKNPEFEEQAEILCFEGGRTSVRAPKPCTWGDRPTNAYVARADDQDEAERLVGVLLQTQTRYSVPKVRIPDWYHKTFLSYSKASGLRPTETDRRNYTGYLGDFIHTIRQPRPGCGGTKDQEVRFCVTSEEEHSKCQDFSRAFEGQGFWPDIGCVTAASKVACMQLVKEDNAQIVVLDGGDVYKAGRYYGLSPVASELYNGSDATYYAVAILRSASDVKKLSDLRGLRSCHTGIGRTAGWVMPVGVLAAEGLLPSDNNICNHAGAVADFFSAGSCVPGANDTKYNKDRVRSEDLCRHCVGDEAGLNKCSRDSRERFSGYAGALRCLAEGKGDVAFAKHSTVPSYTDGHSQLPWTKDLISSDFMLLCDGGDTSTVTDYLNCNWGKVPAHQVVANKGISEDRLLNVVRLLADSSSNFADDSKLYRLFRPGDRPDLLFKDSATGLKVNPLDQTYDQVLGRRFFQASNAADPKQC